MFLSGEVGAPPVPDQVTQSGRAAGLYEIRLGTKFQTTVQVAFQAGGADRDSGKAVKLRLRLEPREEFKPIHQGHLYVCNQEARERKPGSVGILAVTPQIIHRLLPVSHGLDTKAHPSQFEGSTHQKNVVLFVFHEQDWPFLGHATLSIKLTSACPLSHSGTALRFGGLPHFKAWSCPKIPDQPAHCVSARAGS
jgi:hypothetical protein